MEFPDKENLKNRFEKYDDNQLIEILKRRSDYQKIAVEVATEMAIERGLIHSAEDLLGPEFQHSKSYSGRLFPVLETEQQNTKVYQSLIRILYLTTLIPALFAFLSYADGDQFRMIVLGGLALAWGGTTFWLDNKMDVKAIYLLVILLGVAKVYFFVTLPKPIRFEWIDVVIIAISLLLLVYILAYVFVLIRRKQRG